jgi:hypothetical protein
MYLFLIFFGVGGGGGFLLLVTVFILEKSSDFTWCLLSGNVGAHLYPVTVKVSVTTPKAGLG